MRLRVSRPLRPTVRVVVSRSCITPRRTQSHVFDVIKSSRPPSRERVASPHANLLRTTRPRVEHVWFLGVGGEGTGLGLLSPGSAVPPPPRPARRRAAQVQLQDRGAACQQRLTNDSPPTPVGLVARRSCAPGPRSPRARSLARRIARQRPPLLLLGPPRLLAARSPPVPPLAAGRS